MQIRTTTYSYIVNATKVHTDGFYVKLQQYISWNNVKTLQKVGPSATFNNAPR